MPPPKLITLDIPDLQMEYVPNPYGFKLLTQGAELSNPREWRMCNIRPNLYQLRHVNWKNRHYEFNSKDRSVWIVAATAFCKTGGKASEMKVDMSVTGASASNHPKKLTIKFPDSRISYDPASGDFKFMCHDIQMAHLPFWRVLRMQAHLYQIKFNFWEDFFWEVDTYNKTVLRVTGVNFGAPEGGERSPLALQLKIDE